MLKKKPQSVQDKALNAQEKVILGRLGLTAEEYSRTASDDQDKALNTQEKAILEGLNVTPQEYAKASL